MGGIFDLAGETIEGWGVDCGGVTHHNSKQEARKERRKGTSRRERGRRKVGRKERIVTR